jgi:hypothetical protein
VLVVVEEHHQVGEDLQWGAGPSVGPAHLSTANVRPGGRRHLGAGARVGGWALALSLVFLTHSADNPLMAGIGQRTLRAVLG